MFLFPLCFFPLKGMASKSSKTLFSLLIIHLFALSQCKSPFKISRMSHVARSTKFRGDIHKGKCRCQFFFFFFSYYTFYNGHVCLIPKIPNSIHSFFFIRMLFSRARLNILIFPPILGCKYSCIILNNSLWHVRFRIY